ncbi:alcohol oxidase [Fusarium subglutinans]|uniref:Alcohol oxidase n=1 Tax=Gibberella subglutinans TaxID=42677 RepID=A0A8H5Q6W6_GIBSU|nr:alcohol oxidase [Fusarium subglutinans]KAF5608586.1 alcohol oxidase [Fusarium subglutinans]
MAVTNGAYFDFIIVGGGTAGNIVAARLAENPNARILVVEAVIGTSKDNEEIRTPGLAMDIRGSKYDWAYKTTMIKRDEHERIEKPNTRGKALGGSSSLNYFSWVPGSKGTFDMWEEYGGKEWTWEPLIPYLRKSVTYHDDAGLYPPELKKIGAGGPIPIAHAELMPEMKPFRDLLTKAWKSTGEPVSENIFDGTMRASGEELDLYATREVIVSQGVFEFPKLLMLSGIGPKAELAKHNIPLLVDSPHVGQHLLDHPGVPFVLKVKDSYSMDSHVLRKGALQDKVMSAYANGHAGPMGSPFLEMIGFPRIDSYLEKSPEYRAAKAANDGLDPFCPYGQPLFELDFIPLFGSAFQWHFPHPNKGSYMTVMVDLVRPVSEGGEVTLNSADPLQQANINLNYFNNDLDIIAMREGIRFSYDVLKNGEGFEDVVEDEYPWDMPLHDDEAMKRTVLDRSQTSFHPCGTARLAKSIEQGVVSPSLQVYGIKNLRVIDASVIPVIPDCRIQNSVYMVAEKGADAIKQDHTDLYH